MAEIEEKLEEVTEQPLKGRAAWLDRYKKGNPEAGEEIDDEALFEFANGNHSDLESRYNNVQGMTDKMYERASQDPRASVVLSEFVGEKPQSLPYIMGKVYGRDWMDQDLEEFETGYQENLKQLAESKKLQEEAAKNIEKSIQHIEKYISDKQLSEEDAAQLNENIIVFAENLLMGIVPPELIELVHKGLNYDQDVQDAIDTGAVQAKNERIDPELRKLTDTSDVVDMGSSTGSGKKRQAPGSKKGSFYDGLKEEQV